MRLLFAMAAWQICLATLICFVAILELAMAAWQLQAQCNSKPQTCPAEAPLLLLVSAFHLVLFVIVAILALTILCLVCLEGSNNPCNVMLIISIAIVSCSKVGNRQCYEAKAHLRVIVGTTMVSHSTLSTRLVRTMEISPFGCPISKLFAFDRVGDSYSFLRKDQQLTVDADCDMVFRPHSLFFRFLQL